MRSIGRLSTLALALVVSFACTNQQPAADAAPAHAARSHSQAASALPVFVGYADSVRANGNFPVPWLGSPNTLFLGGCDSFDAGAIRLDNPSASPLLIDKVLVDLQRPGPVFDLWGSFTIPAGGSAILTQTSCYDFDTSDFPLLGGCSGTLSPGDPRVPKITVTAGGGSTDYFDTGHVLDTGGVDIGGCGGNESLAWRPVGSAAADNGTDSLTLAPLNETLPPGSTCTATATLLDPSSGPVANVAISFAVTLGPDAGRAGTSTTDANGNATFSFTGAASGTDTLVATLTNAAGGSLQSNSATISWSATAVCPAAGEGGPLPPQLTYLGATSGEYSDPFSLAALLTDGSGTPLAGRVVTFALGAQAASGTTDARGVAHAALAPSGTPGATPLSASFAGDAADQPAQVSLSAALGKDETALRYAGKTALAAGAAQTVSAVLFDPDDGAPIAGKQVTFQTCGASASATTDATGTATATLTISSRAQLGPASLSISFAGDSFRLASSTSAPIVAYAPSDFVIWGGNTAGLHLGDTVNLWGSQWDDQVKQGDYSAGASFKGFANSVTAFAVCEPTAHTSRAPLLDNKCWSVKPGNCDPPGSVPEYVGVIVSNAIAKSGSSIYGNIEATAIVKVDSSCFKPDPGHSIFGTLVANIDGAAIVPTTLVAVQTQPAAVLPAQHFNVSLDLVAGSSSQALRVGAAETFTGSTPASASANVGTVASAHRVSTFAEIAPTVAPRGGSESSAAYQSRLGAADGMVLSSNATLTFQDALYQPQLPVLAHSFSLLSLPRLSLALTGLPCVGRGRPSLTCSRCRTWAARGR